MYYECAYTMHVLLHYINWFLLCWTIGYTSPKTWSGAQFAVGDATLQTKMIIQSSMSNSKNTKQLI